MVTLELVDWVVGLLKIEVLQLRPTIYVKLVFDLPIISYHIIYVTYTQIQLFSPPRQDCWGCWIDKVYNQRTSLYQS